MRILLIEDDASLAAGLSLALRDLGYTVDHVASGAAALLALRGDHPDIAVLDLGLPDMDGLELLRRLRSGRNDNRDNPPVLILTARDAVEQKVAGLDLGADDYLIKPFDMSELDARLRALARRGSGGGSSVIEWGDIRLDTARREVLLRDEAVPLSRREYTLLWALLEQAGRVLTREQLENRLYGWDEEPASNAIEVHVHHLRRKLGVELIDTVRGVGYRVPEPPRESSARRRAPLA